jgi:hypothetical protein
MNALELWIATHQDALMFCVAMIVSGCSYYLGYIAGREDGYKDGRHDAKLNR